MSRKNIHRFYKLLLFTVCDHGQLEHILWIAHVQETLQKDLN